MPSLAIQTRGLSKRYRVQRRKAYDQLGDVLWQALRSRGRRSAHSPAPTKDRFIWALQDVDLEIEEGQVFGVIGRNGAGKSTLLKVLSQITEPTRGYADVRGRIASFLEVGTGFHPELTGRENVYLSGAILGMRKREIDQKFDEIIDFAEIPRFVDTQVKFYSSGMYVRLGFAVAAFLDSDVLLLDEVLAVGDHRFQQKCLRMMRRVGETGETVVFVSHNVAAVRALCTSCALVDDGRVGFVGSAEDCVRAYLEEISDASLPRDADLAVLERRAGEGNSFRFTALRFRPDYDDGKVRAAGPLRVLLEFVVTRDLSAVTVGIVVYSQEGTTIFECLNTDNGPAYELTPGRYVAEVIVPSVVLAEGRYAIGVVSRRPGENLDWIRESLEFEVVSAESVHGWDLGGRSGLVRVASEFRSLQRIGAPSSVANNG